MIMNPSSDHIILLHSQLHLNQFRELRNPGMHSNRRSTVAAQPRDGQPTSPASGASTSEQLDDSTVEAVPPAPKEATQPHPPPHDVVMEEPVRLTRARSRRTQAPSSDR
ncbi:hypothetical protein AAHA92_33214 [Salvia divinorum]|uniref:Uncharacterized protein n=1 Tax=Salvia divinorum TaxID=28513 RepID=A0ABD1FP76_SALDI